MEERGTTPTSRASYSLTPPFKEIKWKDPSLKPGFASCPGQPCSATHRTQLCFQLGLLKSLFSVFALKELEPGVPACPGKLHTKASAGAERQPSPGHGHGPTALKVRRSSAHFPISHFRLPLTHPSSPNSPLCSQKLQADKSLV